MRRDNFNKIQKATTTLILVFTLVCVLNPLLSFAERPLSIEDIPSNTSPEIAELIRNTFSDDDVQRVIAAAELGQLGARAAPAIPFLLQLLDDDNPKSKGLVNKPEHYLQCDAFYPFRIEDHDFNTPCGEACLALRAIGEPAVKPLMDILKDKNVKTDKREYAIWILKEVYQPSMKKLFLQLLADKSEHASGIRLGAVTGLSNIDDTEIRSLYCQILQDANEDDYLKYNIINKFNKRSRLDDSLRNAIHKIFNNKKEELMLRAYAGFVLAIHADDEMLAELSKILDDKNENKDVRGQIADGLGYNTNQKAKDILHREIHKKDLDIRTQVLWGLGNTKDPKLEDIVIKLADSGDYIARIDVFISLAQFDSMKALNKVVSIIQNKNEDEDVRWNALDCLYGFDRKEAIDQLFEILRDKDIGANLEKHALGVLLTGFRHNKINEYIAEKWIEVLNDKSAPKNFRKDAVLAIGYSSKGTEKVLAALSNAVTDEDAEVRKNVAFVLGKIGTKAEISALKQLEQDKIPEVSNIAKKAIHKIEKRSVSVPKTVATRLKGTFYFL